MEHKINEVITYNHEGETIYLKVTPTKDSSCQGCFFHLKYNCGSNIKNIVGQCYKEFRTDNTPVIFKQINNKIMKKTIDIYTVMQTSKKDRDLCYNFTSFKEANKQFEKFVQMWEKTNKVKAKGWTSPAAPYQLKVSRIGDITLYLCKESIDIEDDSNKQSSEIYKKDVLGKWINVDDINPIKIKDISPGDYVILRVQYDSIKFDYKLGYVDCIRDGKVMFNIQSINVLRAPIKITDFYILPDYISNNFYKTNNK